MVSTIRIDDLSTTSVSEAIILALAGMDDIDPLEIPPLAESVNPIALDSLFEDDSFSGSVTFHYEDFEITVTSDGEITIAP